MRPDKASESFQQWHIAHTYGRCIIMAHIIAMRAAACGVTPDAP
ncbi:MAG TPA: hypothetical protein VHU19_15450 [Pyrinomonadaceae bacterium]|nr:hypothetical protein [Pyrinomonadaceae bacterium]